jgi:PAS domain S-box-containing protein
MEFLLNMTMLISEITYQKIESEELNLALKTSEQRWLFAIEGSELGLWDWDAQTNEVFYSAQWKRLLGFDDNEIGNSFGEWDKRVHPDDKEQVYIELNRHLEGKSPVYTSEHRLLCKDGSYKWILDRGKVMVSDTDNKPLRVIGTHTDITSLKIKEQQLIESERRFGKIFHNSPIGVNIVRLSNNTSVDINESYLNIIGYSRNEVIGKTAEELNLFVDFGTREKWQEELKRTGKIKNQLARFRSKSGEIKDVLASIEVIEIGGEKLSLIAAMDVTDQKKAEEKIKKLNEELEEKVNNRTFELSQNQAALINLVEDINEKSGQLEKYAGLLEAKNKELETFTYSVSHDLKAPLRGIDGYSKLLSDIYAGSLTDEAKHFINVIRNSTMQMGRLIDDLLNYSRLERSMFRKENIAMQSFVHAILTTYRKELEELHFETETSIPGITIEADSTGLSIILRNFIGNAIKFANTAENPKIEIALAEADDVWTISVKDNGIGFDMKYHDRIFDIFQRLHRAEDFPGTGVGLAMVSKAIARMGGKAWAKSTPGHGATFFVEIPKSFTYES